MIIVNGMTLESNPGFLSYQWIDENGNNIEVGFIPRPTDQRINFSMFFQDYIPGNMNYKMHLNMVLLYVIHYYHTNILKHQLEIFHFLLYIHFFFLLSASRRKHIINFGIPKNNGRKTYHFDNLDCRLTYHPEIARKRSWSRWKATFQGFPTSPRSFSDNS